ncbi:hypothetical protein [Leptospira santarosai]|uniref:hypothetical protein n=1 Tax=Leptospira santarosai TaxID=28183 RepID=UPI000518F6FC|nr:hypothetical protein [Leptospira santarosai]
MPKIKYCRADEFLNNYLPSEMKWKRQPLTSGGNRILLYFNDEIQPENGKHFSEFGREYKGQHNTNEPHELYIKLTLDKIHSALIRIGRSPSFGVENVMNAIPWREKDKQSLSIVRAEN